MATTKLTDDNAPVSRPSTSSTPDDKKGPAESKPEHEYPSPSKRWLLMVCVYISVFLVALDKNIIATAIPVITDHFHSLGDIGWYGSSYLLTTCAFQLLWGRIYTFYSVKPVFLSAILVFEIGSVVCGAAPSSTAFIVGRAVAGLGSAGMMNGAIMIIVYAVPLEKRPMFQGLLAAIFGVSSVIGPLLGGAFTERVSWRWCFYINLPLGAVATAILVLVLHIPTQNDKERVPLVQQFKKLDPLGTLFFLPGMVCLLLALQWGGTTYAWSSWRLILLLTLFSVLFLAWLAVQVFMPDTATVPMRILTQRTIAAAFAYALSSQGSALVIFYYIPLFFQALKEFSPINSGLATLPTVLSLVIGAIGAGAVVQRLGYPAPFMIASSVLAAIGAGLITTWKITAGPNIWIGYQVLYGIGVGLGLQGPNLMAQIVLPRPDVPTGISLMVFSQNLGNAIFVSVAQNVFADRLASGLAREPGLNLSATQISQMGATMLRDLVPKELLGGVLEAYRLAIQQTFYVGVGLSAFGLLGALAVEWRSTKSEEQTGQEGKGEKNDDLKDKEKVEV